MQQLTDANWETEVLASTRPVAVLFWAPWSVPSRTAVETVEAVERQRRGPLSIGVVQVDGSPKVAERYAIQGLPTLIVFRGGQAVERRVGLMSREDLTRLLERQVSG